MDPDRVMTRQNYRNIARILMAVDQRIEQSEGHDMKARTQSEQEPRSISTEDLVRLLRPKVSRPKLDDRVLVWEDSHRKHDRVLRWDGPCLGCSVQLWSFDDGENDPRGILGDSAMMGVPIPPRDDQPDDELEARGCPLCASDEQLAKVIEFGAVHSPGRSLPYQWGKSTLAD